MMKRRLLAAVAAVCVVPSFVVRALPFTENFDVGSPSWTITDAQDNGIDDFSVDLSFDYSGLGIGTAPKGGGQRGARLKANLTNNGLPLTAGNQEEGINIYPTGQSFSGDYRLKFDVYMGVVGTVGTTEFSLFGINATGTRTNWDSFFGPGTDGLFYGFTGDGGSTIDYRGYEGVLDGDPDLFVLFDNEDALPQATFPSTDGAPTNQWVEVEVSTVASVVTMKLNGVVFDQFTNVGVFTSGNIFLGYQDIFPSVNPDNFAIYDNVTVAAVDGPKWEKDASGTWEERGNWLGAVPDAVGAAANFVTPLSSATVVTLGSGKTVGSINFDSINSYTIDGAELTLNNGDAAAVINLVSGSHSINAAVTMVAGVNVTLGAGRQLSLGGGLTGTGGLDVAGGGLVLVSLLNVGAVTVSGGELRFSGDGVVNLITELGVNDGSVLSFGNNSLVVNYDEATPIGTILEYLLAGKLVADGDAGGLPTFLAIAEAADLGLTEFGGVPVDETAVLVKFTYVGDANLDGQVDALDYERVDLAIGNTGVFGTAQGDLNYDGSVDALDYEQIDLNIGNGVGSPLASVFVPEPAAVSLLAGAGVLALRRRK
jgi:hypothetical protein